MAKMEQISVSAYAKVNFTLDILGREGGYHLLDSLVSTVDLCDRVTARRRTDADCTVAMRGVGAEAIAPDSNALRAAQADFVFEREQGLQYPLAAHGVNLSGGQKQRILIARALAGEPDVLILDDSSSALDYRTDAALRAAISREYPDLTCIFIAQRISSVRFADKILVLDGGRIVDIGKHDELIQRCEIYREIAQSQLGKEAV